MKKVIHYLQEDILKIRAELSELETERGIYNEVLQRIDRRVGRLSSDLEAAKDILDKLAPRQTFSLQRSRAKGVEEKVHPIIG